MAYSKKINIGALIQMIPYCNITEVTYQFDMLEMNVFNQTKSLSKKTQSTKK